jgi:flavin reductase (DIM6/NTAB) family NADH-FMN oxidoreductase RutF
MEFVINLTTEELARAADWSGVRSGKKYDKFRELNLTPIPAHTVRAPYIDQSPLCIECRVKEIHSLGTHDMFLAEVVNILADEKYIDAETGKFDIEKARLLVYSHGNYYGTGKHIGKFGWSVKKKKL